MAISLLGSTSGANTGSDDTIDLTPYSMAQNDVVVVHLCRRATSNTTPAITTAGYTAAYANVYSNSTNDSNLRSFYKIMGATPDTSVTITTTGFSNTQAYAIQIFRGVDTTTPLDGVTPTTATTTGASAADAPSITPTTAGAWIVAAAGVADATGGTGSTTFTVPANMTNMVAGDNDRAKVGAALKTDWASGAFDPSAFGGGSTAAGNGSSAATFVLKPAAGGGSPQGLTPSLVTDSDTFFAPTVSATKALTPSLVTDADTFFSATVGRGPVGLTPNLFTDADTFYTSVVGRGSVNVSPSLFTNTQSFYAHVVGGTAADQSLTAGLFTNTGTLYAPVVSSTYTITAPLLVNAQVFYGPVVTAAPGASQNLAQQYILKEYSVWYSPDALHKNKETSSLVFKIGYLPRR